MWPYCSRFVTSCLIGVIVLWDLGLGCYLELSCVSITFLVPAIAVTLVCRFSQRIYKQVFCNNTGLVRDLCCCSQQARPAVSLCNPAVRLDPVVKQDRRSCFTTGSQPDGCKVTGLVTFGQNSRFGCFVQKCVCCV